MPGLAQCSHCLMSVVSHMWPPGASLLTPRHTDCTSTVVIMNVFSGHDFLLDSVVNNVINNITVDLPSLTNHTTTTKTTTTTTANVPETTADDYDESISNEIQVGKGLLSSQQRDTSHSAGRHQRDNHSGAARPVTAI